MLDNQLIDKNKLFIEEGSRLRKVRLLLDENKNLTDFAEEMDMAYTNYSRVENGYRDVPKSLLIKLSNVSKGNMRVNIEYLLTGKGEPLKPIEKENTAIDVETSIGPLFKIPLLNIKAQAGDGSTSQLIEYSGEFIEIPTKMQEGDLGIQVKGNSMAGVLEHGDIIVVRKYLEPIDKKKLLVVAESDGSCCVKFVERLGEDKFQLISQNNSYLPRQIDASDVLGFWSPVLRITSVVGMTE
jgi:transcriptional regulator with XRE-family HTH domain